MTVSVWAIRAVLVWVLHECERQRCRIVDTSDFEELLNWLDTAGTDQHLLIRTDAGEEYGLRKVRFEK